MSSPLLFFIFIIVIDLVLKSFRDKKKIERSRQNKQQELQNNSSSKPSYKETKTNPSRNIMSTLREEIEKERQKEISRRQKQIQPQQKPKVEEVKQISKAYQDKEYWDNKKEQDTIRQDNIHRPINIKVTDTNINERNMKEDIIRGIIFSEILSPPKSIQNQKRSM